MKCYPNAHIINTRLYVYIFIRYTMNKKNIQQIYFYMFYSHLSVCRRNTIAFIDSNRIEE